MARIEDLIQRVDDPELRRELRDAVKTLKAIQTFGIVFEEHIPETTALVGRPISVGDTVQIRTAPGSSLHRVISIEDGKATIRSIENGDSQIAKSGDLLLVKRFGEPVFPTLTSVGSVQRGGPSRPAHAVINGENYHALKLLLFACAGQVDCIYIDPPYNTGARDWRYNNRYVDSNDAYRHSKWLSFMQKRLKLAKDLLKPNGVLIVMVDEHELHHLGMVVESVFRDPDYLRYTVTIVNNPKGTYKANFGRVDEQALFIVPNLGHDVINPKPAAIEKEDDSPAEVEHALINRLIEIFGLNVTELLADDSPLKPELRETLEVAMSVGADEEEDAQPNGSAEPLAAEEAPPEPEAPSDYEYLFLRRRGQESSHRQSRPNQFYAILVDEDYRRVVSVGPPIGKDEKYTVSRAEGLLTVYPVNKDGEERVWRYNRETMQKYIDEGAIVVGRHSPDLPQPYTLNHRRLKKSVRRLKTVWWDKAHDSGTHGTNVVNAFLGKRNLFPFPKSLYAVRDCLAAVVSNRPNALIVDFFAGSGTTFHSTCLLNAEDGGQRRTIMVTNNEVSDGLAAELHQRNLWRADSEFEKYGIFESVTQPRCTAVVTGKLADGRPVPGTHRGGRPYAEGFAENIEFFRLDYLDPDDVELGDQYGALEPVFWLGAGALGVRTPAINAAWTIPDGAKYGVLFQETRFRSFVSQLNERTDVDTVYLVTDSEESYAEMCDALPNRLVTRMLYRDYLRYFRSRVEPSG